MVTRRSGPFARPSIEALGLAAEVGLVLSFACEMNDECRPRSSSSAVAGFFVSGGRLMRMNVLFGGAVLCAALLLKPLRYLGWFVIDTAANL